MAPSNTTITVKDGAGADRAMIQRLMDSPLAGYVPAGVLYYNDALVSPSNKLGVVDSQLATLIAALTSAGAAGILSKKYDDPAGTADLFIPHGYVRRDTIGTITAENGDYSQGFIDSVGGINTSKATADAAEFDNVQTMPYPGVNRFVSKSGSFTAATTGTVIHTPGAGKIFVCTYLYLSWSGGTNGVVTVWFSTTATSDTSFTRGTDQPIFDASLEPATKGAGGWSSQRHVPGPVALTANPLRITIVGAMADVKYIAEGYEVDPTL